ncbi:MAG: TetR/AcrR family transcriptional regulator [Gemmatimonadaceae bacterium]
MRPSHAKSRPSRRTARSPGPAAKKGAIKGATKGATKGAIKGATKGARTKELIVDRALELASREGLGGITIGALAEYVGMSKGGLFAHFVSKEDLQFRVVEAAIARFRSDVVELVLAAAPGVPRLRAVMELWMGWDGHERLPGGCPFVAFAAELDEQPGGSRDLLVEAQARWMALLALFAGEAVEAGELPPATDAELFAFQLHGVLLSYHQAHHLMRDPRARARAEAALEMLLGAHRALAG